MQIRNPKLLLVVLVGAFLLATAALFWPQSQASAQCGSQASSCKNCHEVQGQDPVNTDGTGWHQSHAFGDFCYICHAGNNQSMVAEEAHTGMVPPMSDVEAACQQCHPADLMERSQVYATALGVEIGTGGEAPPSGSSPSSPAPAGGETSTAAGDAFAGGGLVVADAEVVDYVARYEGKTPINWANVIAAILIVAIALGGGAFVVYNESKLRGKPLFALRAPQAAFAPATPAEAPAVPGYAQEVTALLPLIAQLSPVGVHALRRILQNPEQANEMLHSLAHLDPELVRQLRGLDRQSRALLLALSGD